MNKATCLLMLFLFGYFTIAAQPAINRVEYFVDTDPGFGAGINVPITPGANISNQNFNVDISVLQNGMHSLWMRSRDANNKWSIATSLLFVKSSLSLPASNVVKAEYFVDTDPGFGLATNIPIANQPNIADQSFLVNINGLNEGIHYLFVRTKNANGQWSIVERTVFAKLSSLSGPPAKIVRAETFIDTDPGFGKAVPLALNAAGNLPDYVFPLNLTGLAAGKHYYYVRGMDSLGKWSTSNVDSFTISSTVATPRIQVNSVTGKRYCGSQEFQLAFHATGSYNAGNQFQVQLSDAAGSFAQPIIIGSFTGVSSALVTCQVPLHIPNGNGYKVRVVSSNPGISGATSDSVFVLNDQPRFADTTVFTVCLGETVNLNTVYQTGAFSTLWNTGTPAAAPNGQYQVITTNTATLQCKDTANVTVQQNIVTWTGAVSNNWHTAGNWSTGAVPTVKSHVIIPAGTPNTCVLSLQNGDAASLQVRTGAQFSMQNGRVVNVVAKCNPLPN